MITWLANHLWIGLCSVTAKNYRNASQNIRKTQEDILLSMVHDNQGTEYGGRFNFSEIRTIIDYQSLVPITEYEDYQPYIQRISGGEPWILTSEPVRIFELSSGSTAPSKLIPYTGRLKQQFGAGIDPWVDNLYHRYPKLFRGKAYWSVTPVTFEQSYTAGGIPIGFEEDTEYFGKIKKKILDYLFAVPGEVKYISDMDGFRYVTLLFLLKEKGLALISIWNPTFLNQLLEPLGGWKDRLLQDLETGAVNPPGEVAPELLGKLRRKLGKHPRRAREIRYILGSESKGLFDGKTVYELIWPHLELISCWTDANAGQYVAALRDLFPSVRLQGKGLIATEGFVSLPFVGEEGARLAVRSHFFEFEEMDQNGNKTGKIMLADELESGRSYGVILTTGGGFYRYRLRDIIQVVGFSGPCPRIRFLGKESMVSDLCGEKLNEFHVRQVLEHTFDSCGIHPVFSMVAPENDGVDSYYVLYLEFDINQKPGAGALLKLASMVESHLAENFHYQYCRDLSQLKPLRLFIIEDTIQRQLRGVETYYRVCGELGIRTGHIKMFALHPRTGWAKAFPGSILK